MKVNKDIKELIEIVLDVWANIVGVIIVILIAGLPLWVFIWGMSALIGD